MHGLYPMHNLSLINDPFSHGQNKPYNLPNLSFGLKGTSLCSASIYYTKFSLFPVQLRAGSRPCVQISPLKIVSTLNVPLPKFGHPLISLSLFLSRELRIGLGSFRTIPRCLLWLLRVCSAMLTRRPSYDNPGRAQLVPKRTKT